MRYTIRNKKNRRVEQKGCRMRVWNNVNDLLVAAGHAVYKEY